MIRNIIGAIFLITLLAGCGASVQHTLTSDYDKKMPVNIVVLPVSGNAEDMNARYLFRNMIQEKLFQMQYFPVLLETVDDKLLRMGIKKGETLTKGPKELGEIFDADSVLYAYITEWDTTLFLTYASINIGARFELYDRVSGEKLWESEFNSGESDMNMERDVLRLRTTKAYEPVIQHIINVAFSTLPMNKINTSKKTYYDWLP